MDAIGNIVVGGGLFAAAGFFGKALLDYFRGSKTDAMKAYSDLYALVKKEHEESKVENKILRQEITKLKQQYNECRGDCAALREKVAQLEANA